MFLRSDNYFACSTSATPFSSTISWAGKPHFEQFKQPDGDSNVRQRSNSRQLNRTAHLKTVARRVRERAQKG